MQAEPFSKAAEKVDFGSVGPEPEANGGAPQGPGMKRVSSLLSPVGLAGMGMLLAALLMALLYAWTAGNAGFARDNPYVQQMDWHDWDW